MGNSGGVLLYTPWLPWALSILEILVRGHIESVVPLLVRDDRLSLGEFDGVCVLNDLIHADQGCYTVVRGDLDFVVSDVD